MPDTERPHQHLRLTRYTTQDAGVAHPFAEITLDRPEKRNALTSPMLETLRKAVESLADDDRINAILLTGKGPALCAGFDLKRMAEDPAHLRDMLRELAAAVIAMRRCLKPIVVAAHGAAVAGGCALLAGADTVIADPDCKLGYPVTKLGISPAVSAPTLANAIGIGHARRRLLDPGIIDAREAQRIGLVHILASSPEDVRPHAHIQTQHLAAKPPAALAATKQWLNECDRSDDDTRAAAGLNASLELVGNHEERTRIAAAIGATA